jgi:hypothetical protein
MMELYVYLCGRVDAFAGVCASSISDDKTPPKMERIGRWFVEI